MRRMRRHTYGLAIINLAPWHDPLHYDPALDVALIAAMPHQPILINGEKVGIIIRGTAHGPCQAVAHVCLELDAYAAAKAFPDGFVLDELS